MRAVNELGREPTIAEITERVTEQLEAQEFDPRLPFSGRDHDARVWKAGFNGGRRR